MIHQRNSKPLQDSAFQPGTLCHLVVGNTGRLLDPRRTPVRMVEIDTDTGTMAIEILDFEDRGAIWLIPFEEVGRYQFAPDQPWATVEEVARYEAAITRLNRPLCVTVDPLKARQAAEQVSEARERAGAWLAANTTWLGHPYAGDPTTGVANQQLVVALQAYMDTLGVSELEAKFARQYVSNPDSGDFVKAHRIIMAEIGLCPFDGKIVRDETVFTGHGTKEQRVRHILARLGFVQAALRHAFPTPPPIYRAITTREGLTAPRNKTFVSATFRREVAESFFAADLPTATAALFRQPLPLQRVFMTCLETPAMTGVFQEAEVVLLFDGTNEAF